MPARSTLLSIVLVLCLHAALAAQKVVPAANAVFDANDQSYYPFYLDAIHVQQIYDGAEIAQANAQIQAIAYRRDVQDNTDTPGLTRNNVTISLGHTLNTPATMSTTFANNPNGPMTTVLTGANLNLPNQPPALVIAFFNVPILFSVPFPYDRTRGNLLLDYAIPGTPTRKTAYRIDGAYVGQNGRWISIGTANTLSGGGRAALGNRAPATQLVPGGNVDLQVSGLRQSYPAVLILGTSSTIGSLGYLPLDLAPFGAPGNFLYTSTETVWPFPVSPSGNFWAGRAQFTIPQGLAGAVLFGQAVFLDPPANNLQIVTSTGISLIIGGMAGTSPTQVMGSDNPSSPTGSFWYANGTGGPVTEFRGTFN